MSRRMARETAMKCCFAREFNSERADEPPITTPTVASILALTEEPDLIEEDLMYAEEIVEGVQENIDSLDAQIRELAIGWEFGRMPRVDICIMRVALYEMIYRGDIPESVSINEAVDIAKKYSGEKSAPYINGMLGTFSRKRAGEGGEAPQYEAGGEPGLSMEPEFFAGTELLAEQEPLAEAGLFAEQEPYSEPEE